MKEFIYPEMMVHVPMCTHKEPQNIIVISENVTALSTELERYRDISVKVLSASNALEGLREAGDDSADLILCEVDVDAAVAAHLNRVLNSEGLVVMKHPSLDDIQENTVLMQVLGNYCSIIMPYQIGNGETLLLASKAYHPTADIILQRADLLEGLQYYNSDIHPAAFAMPNYIRKQYLGVIRN